MNISRACLDCLLSYLVQHDRWHKRDMRGVMFPEPAVSQNIAALHHFTCRGQGNVMAFLKTLSAGYFHR
jgi:hypothetical protein